MRRSLEKFLLEDGRVTREQLGEAYRTLDFFGGSLLFSLVRVKALSEAEAAAILSQWTGYPPAPMKAMKDIPPQILRLVEAAAAERRRLLPFCMDGRTLSVATSRADNEVFLSNLARRIKCEVQPYSVLDERLDDFLAKNYGIPARSRDAVAVAPVDDRSRPPATPAPEKTRPRPASQPSLGLDGLPLDSEAPAPEIVALPDLPGDLEETAVPVMDRGGDLEDATAAPPPLMAATGDPAQPPPPGPGTEADTAPLLNLANARDRQEIGAAAVALAPSCKSERIVLFSVQKERVVGWNAHGRRLDPERLRRLSIPLYTPSIFASLRVKASPYVGIVPDQPANRELLAALGGDPPRMAAVIPIVLKGRPVAALYADNGPGGTQVGDLDALKILAGKIALALEILLLRRKIAQPPLLC